ncbi:MAG: hypothetical protein PHU66_05750, partial [Bacteroidaceae bacterium]|nr:hypothetical protein [Bacteroidaceae bacterium]
MIYVLVGIKNNKGTRMTRIGRMCGYLVTEKKITRSFTEEAQRFTEFFSVVLGVASVCLCVRRKMWIHGFARGNNKIGLFKVSEK